MVKRRKGQKRRHKALRVPKGVRVGGRSIGGRFISADKLGELVSQTDDAGRTKLLRAIERQRVRRQHAYERVSRRFDDDPKVYGMKLAQADADFRRWQEIEDSAFDLSDEDALVEWEIGVDYHPIAAPTSSHVDINIRIRRADNRPMGFDTAKRVMNELRDNLGAGRSNPVPRGYVVAGVDWKRPYHAFDFTEGTPEDLDVFRDVLYIAADTAPWRLGGVDE